jgi:flagellar basal-body rod protein FlgC
MTNNTIKTALSGLKAAEKQINNSANNIANINTKDYKKRTVNQETVRTGAVTTGVKSSNNLSDSEDKTDAVKSAKNSGVNIAEESVNMIKNLSSAKANAKVIRAEDEMSGNIVDIKS